ncbi:hypothetical protein Tco_1475830 [Tanacetum coccineum]
MDDLVQDFFIRPEGDTFDLDVYDEEHVVQEVEVNMGDFNFQVKDASTGTDGNMIPVAPKVNLTEDNIEVLDFDSLESDLEDVPENDRSFIEDYVIEAKENVKPDTTVKIEYMVKRSCISNKPVQDNIVCMGALKRKRGFREGGRELLGLDGAFMRGQYPGQMLT